MVAQYIEGGAYKLAHHYQAADGSDFKRGEMFKFAKPMRSHRKGGVFISQWDEQEISRNLATKYEHQTGKPLFIKA